MGQEPAGVECEDFLIRPFLREEVEQVEHEREVLADPLQGILLLSVELNTSRLLRAGLLALVLRHGGLHVRWEKRMKTGGGMTDTSVSPVRRCTR